MREVRDKLLYIDAMRDSLISLRTRTELKLNHLNDNAEELDKILAVFRGLEVQYRERLQTQLSAVVSRAVSAVFDEDIQISIENTTFRGVTSMAIMVEQDGLKTDIFSAKGGSLVQIVGFALRVLMVIWSGLARVIVLDEPFAMVSAEYRPRVADLLRELSKQLSVQFVIVTHETELVDAADVAYEITKAPSEAAAARLIKTIHEEQA